VTDTEKLAHAIHQMAAGVGSLASAIQAQSTSYPWSLIQPQGVAFDPTAVIVTPTVADGEQDVLSLTIPLGFDAIVNGIANTYIGGVNPDSTQSLIWRIRIDKRYVPNYSTITTQLGTTAVARPIAGIFVGSGQTITYSVKNVDPALPTPGTYIFCSFSGHWWPRQQS
jgi:hypothetical protein